MKCNFFNHKFGKWSEPKKEIIHKDYDFGLNIKSEEYHGLRQTRVCSKCNLVQLKTII